MKNSIKPLVSLIVVCHNHKNFVYDCIMSLVKQSYNNTEIIVFDNGSQDGSVEALHKLQNKYSFNLICQNNIGLPRTLNKAVKLSKGKYVSFISTDDYWPLDKIEIAVKFLEECDPDIAVCGGNAITIDNNGQILRKQTFAGYNELNFRDVFLFGKNIPALTSCIRKKVLLEVGPYDTNIHGEDYLLWLKVTNKGYKIAFLNSLMGCYRHHDNNISHNHEMKISAMEYCLGVFKDDELYSEALNNMYIRQFALYSQINKKIAIKILFKIKRISITKNFLFSLFFCLLPRKIVSKITRSI
jgi:alpha-1,3-rhamnosyltransferase